MIKMCLNKSKQNKKGRLKSDKQKNEAQNIEILYNAQIRHIKLFNDYPPVASETKYKIFLEEGIKILTYKETLQRYQ